VYHNGDTFYIIVIVFCNETSLCIKYTSIVNCYLLRIFSTGRMQKMSVHTHNNILYDDDIIIQRNK